MLRYFAFAAIIVFVGIAVLLVLPRVANDSSRPTRYVSGNGRSGPMEPAPERSSRAFGGVAPWALSAVPECFRQLARYSGPAAFARAHIPRGARRVQDRTVFRSADCTLTVLADSAVLVRGGDRFEVPAPARFYVAGSRLVLDARDGDVISVRMYDDRRGTVIERGR